MKLIKHTSYVLLIILCACFLLAAEGAVANASQVDATSRCHIVFILADDLGYGDVSSYNPNSKIQTPNIDRIAAEGMRFTDAHAGGSYCVPSRYALLTGRFAVRADHLRDRKGPIIDDGRMTIASLLRDRGYSTAMIGKWHLGFETLPRSSKAWFDYAKPFRGGPLDRGFESFFGMHASLDIPPYFYIRDRSPVTPPTEAVAASTSVGGREGWNGIQGEFWRAGLVARGFKHPDVTPRFVQEAEKIIRSHAENKKNKPLFLYLALPSPHTPWLPLEEFRGKSGAGMYGDFVMQVDAAVGRIVDALDTAGMKQDTLLFFSSDNGPVWYDKDFDRFGHRSAGELRGLKGTPWEGGHRMPFVVRWPGKIAAGTVSEQTIVFSDLFATFAELVGMEQIPKSTAEDSVSFLPYLLDAAKATTRRPPIIHDQRTLRDGDWKLILPRHKQKSKAKSPRGLFGELYNLREDPSEQHNRISEYPEIAQRLRERLSSLLTQ